MAEYRVSELVKEVRTALDENATSEQLSGFGDTETLTLDTIIESKIEDAARVIETHAPYYLLDSGKALCDPGNAGADNSITFVGGAFGIGDGILKLPDDFLRLISFKMSDWDIAVYEAITPYDPSYKMQKSKFAGLKGNPQNPVVAIVPKPAGLCLEFYSCRGGEGVSVEEGRYIAIPRIEGGKIQLCEKLKAAIIYYAAHLTSMTFGGNELAATLLATSKELAQISGQQ